MADYLPPVVARLSMDIGDFAAKIAQARSMMQGLGGDFKIGTDGLDAAAAKVKALQASLQGLSGTVKVNTDGMGALAAKTAAAGAAGAQAGAIWAAGWRLTGNALHWIISGGVELAAVVLPALVALAAGLAVAAQGAVMVQQHMTSLYTATEATRTMFGQTIGDVLGLGHALQTAQNAANPSVYGILGSALDIAKGHMSQFASTGLQVVQMFQTFSAKVATEFGPGGSLGGTMNSLLRNMVPDLQGLGQALGNIAHALASFASQMPGLAEVLLRGLVGITGFLSSLAQGASHIQMFGVSILTVVMGFEEFNRWGGLLVTTLTRMGVASASLQGGAFSLARFASVIQGLLSIVPRLTIALAGMFTAMGAEGAGQGLRNAAENMGALIDKIGPLQAGLIAIGAISLGFLIYQLTTARTAAQAFADALQASVMKASNTQAFQVIAQNIAALNNQITQTKAAAPALEAVGAAQDHAAQTGTRFAGSLNMAGLAAMNTKTQLSGLSAGLQQQNQDAANVAAGAAYLARTYGTTFVGALALADQANVKLANGITGTSQSAMVARMQIASMVQGYQAMGAPMSAVGSDMEMLAVQSGLAATKVDQLNSAADQFMANLTGGTTNLAQFNQELMNMGVVVGGVGNRFTQAASISTQVKQFADSLKSFGSTGAQAWQNFNQVVTSGNSLLDWMRTAGAEGALSGTQFKQGMLDMVSSLVPLASASSTAQAEVMGLVEQVDPSIKTWSQLKQAISASGASISGLGGIIGGATSQMENLNAVTQKLGNVLSTALISAMQAAQVQASGVGAAMQKFAQDLMDGNQAAAQADYATVISDLEKLGLTAQQAAALVAQVTQNLKNAQGTYNATLNVDINYTATGGTNAGANFGGKFSTLGYASGTRGAAPGWAWVGEAGPELVRFSGGETVLPHQVSRGYADGAGGPDMHHVHVYLDSREVYSAVQTQAVATQRRTGHTGMARRTR